MLLFFSPSSPGAEKDSDLLVKLNQRRFYADPRRLRVKASSSTKKQLTIPFP